MDILLRLCLILCLSMGAAVVCEEDDCDCGRTVSATASAAAVDEFVSEGVAKSSSVNRLRQRLARQLLQPAEEVVPKSLLETFAWVPSGYFRVTNLLSPSETLEGNWEYRDGNIRTSSPEISSSLGSLGAPVLTGFAELLTSGKVAKFQDWQWLKRGDRSMIVGRSAKDIASTGEKDDVVERILIRFDQENNVFAIETWIGSLDQGKLLRTVWVSEKADVWEGM